MTIERLEELHTLTREMAKEMIDLGRWKDEAVDFSFDICQLIEAEIDQQSVTSNREETMRKIATDLKPCPFCGHDEIIIGCEKIMEQAYACCNACGANVAVNVRDSENFEEIALKAIYEVWDTRSDY